jgi:hypothetical protein
VPQDAAALFAKLAAALAAERAARAQARGALADQAALIHELRAEGLTSTRIAHRLACMDGTDLSVEARKRLAARLRQRLSRVTRSHGDLVLAHGQQAPEAPPSESRKEVEPMAKIIKRVTTVETFTEPDEPDEVDESESEDDAEEQEDADEETAPRRHHRK